MKTKHTPTPWRSIERDGYGGISIIGDNGRDVALVVGHHDAAFILRAVNAHADLLAACEQIADTIQGGEALASCEPWAQELITLARAAIAKAKRTA